MKILFTDFDKTLATDDKQISKEDYEALKKLHEKGVKVVLCTGRMLSSSSKVAELFPYRPIIATDNGGRIVDESGKIIEEKLLSVEEAAEFTRYAEDNGLLCQVYTEEVFVQKDNDYTRKYAEVLRVDYVVTGVPVSEYVLKNKIITSKVLFYDGSGNISVHADFFEKKYGEKYSLWRSGKKFLGIYPKGITKGYAVKRICELYNISTKDAVAVGDASNDIEMLTVAGVGVAVSNGEDCAKEVADYVTENPNGKAIAEVVEKFF